MHRGYIKIWRKVVDNQSWSRGALHRAVMLTLMVKANWKPSHFAGKRIEAGQIAFSSQHLADELGVSRATLWRAIKCLIADGFITSANVGNQFTLVSIVNWHSYQGDFLDDEQQVRRQVNNERDGVVSPENNERDTSKEGKNRRSKKDTSCLSLPPLGGDHSASQYDAQDHPSPHGKKPVCPIEEIVCLYHECLPDHPKVKVLSDTRKNTIRARWKMVGERVRGMETPDDKNARLVWLRRFFGYVAASDFLTGKKHSRDRGPFVADLDFLFSPKGFAGVIEGKYENREAA